MGPVSPQDKSHTRGSLSCLGLVLLPSPRKAIVLVLVRIWNCAKRGVREVHSTARAAAVRPDDRAAWEYADDNLLVSSEFLLQRMFSGFGFVVNRHNDRCGLDSPSNSPVPNHGATSAPSMTHFLETRFYSAAQPRFSHISGPFWVIGLGSGSGLGLGGGLGLRP